MDFTIRTYKDGACWCYEVRDALGELVAWGGSEMITQAQADAAADIAVKRQRAMAAERRRIINP